MRAKQKHLGLSSIVLVLAGLSLLWPMLAAADLPKPFKAIYEVRKAGLKLGRIEVTLEYEAGIYTYKKVSETRGLAALFVNEKVSETSIGLVEDDTLRLVEYHYHQQRGKKQADRSIKLTKDGYAIETYKGNETRYRIIPGTLDRSSVEIALMRDANLNNKRTEYPVAEKWKLRTYRFINQGLKSVEVPAGTFQCIEYHVDRATKNRSTDLCIAPDLDNIPVYAVHTEKGTSFQMVLLRYTPLPE